MDDILVAAEPASGIGGLAALDIPGLLQLVDGGTDGVPALPVDCTEPGQGIVPVLGQGQHLGEQPLGLQGQAHIPEMMVGHNGVVPGLFHAEYGHGKSPFDKKKTPLVSRKGKPGALVKKYVDIGERT